MTDQSRRTGTDALKVGWRRVRQTLLAAAIGFGGWQAAQVDWSNVSRTFDQALWSHALKDRVSAPYLDAAAPVWRERTGASGDLIVERTHANRAGRSTLAVLEGINGRAIPAPVLAEQAAAQHQDAVSQVSPASFDGLSAGDRLTVTTTGGDVFTFEVGANDDAAQDPSIAIRVSSPDSSGSVVLHAIRAVEPETPAASKPQQDL